MGEIERLKEENIKLKENNDIQTRVWKEWLEKQETRKSRENEEFLGEEIDDEKGEYEVRKERGFKKRYVREERDQNGEMGKERKKFCHFWNNGKCKYRDSECWYLHRESPECRYGRKCNFRRCMFYHPEGESYYLNNRKQHSNQKYRDDHYSSESKQYGNHQQRENWSVNGGDSRNYFRSQVNRRWNRD